MKNKFIITLLLLIGLNLILFLNEIKSQPVSFSNPNIKLPMPIDTAMEEAKLIPIVTESPLEQTQVRAISNFTTRTALTSEHRHIPDSYDVATDKLVGGIPLIHSLTSSGATAYSVPIEIVSGRNGFQPNLTIAYNSQGGNSMIGYGWGLAGVSLISRVNSSVFYDGKVASVSNSSPLMLDGMRLLKISSTGTTITYNSEQGNIIVIEDISKNEITATYSNGNKAYYKLGANNSTYVINKEIDLHGNYIDYTYSSLEGNQYIKKISYGGIKTISHFGFVEFSYQNRSDNNAFYINTQKITNQYILSSVKCYSETSLIRTYSLSYISNNGSSQLSQIDCTFPNSVDLNPLKFYYGNANKTGSLYLKEDHLISYLDNPKLNIVKGQTESSDILVTMPEISMGLKPEPRGSAFFLSSVHPDQELLLYTDFSTLYPLTNNRIKADHNLTGVYITDVDGEAGEEIIKINDTDSVRFSIYKLNSYKYSL